MQWWKHPEAQCVLLIRTCVDMPLCATIVVQVYIRLDIQHTQIILATHIAYSSCRFGVYSCHYRPYIFMCVCVCSVCMYVYIYIYIYGSVYARQPLFTANKFRDEDPASYFIDVHIQWQSRIDEQSTVLIHLWRRAHQQLFCIVLYIVMYCIVLYRFFLFNVDMWLTVENKFIFFHLFIT